MGDLDQVLQPGVGHVAAHGDAGPERDARHPDRPVGFGHLRLGIVAVDCVTPHPPGLPLWVVRADNAVVSGHSGFFTRPVTDIVRSLVSRRILEESIAASRPAS